MPEPRSLLVNLDGEPLPSSGVTARDIQREAWLDLAGHMHKAVKAFAKTNAEWEAQMRVEALRRSAGVKPQTTTIRIGLPKRYKKSLNSAAD